MILENVIDDVKNTFVNYINQLEVGFIEVLAVEYKKRSFKDLPFFDYTSVICFKKSYSGFLYVSATEEFMNVFLKKSIKNSSKEYFTDSISELTNMIAGNIGKTLDKNFDISIPLSGKSSIDNIVFSDVICCVIPIRLNGKKSCLVFHIVEN